MLARQKDSAEDIAWVNALGARIEAIGDMGRGGVDDFIADVRDQAGPQALRRDIADRIVALLGGKPGPG